MLKSIHMQTNILWSGIEYYSLENCIIDSQNDGITINSTIIGFYNDIIYRVEYIIRLDRSWQTFYCLVKSQIDHQSKKIEFIKNKNGWTLNGQFRPEFNACLDIDIALTPFTNSLPINRLKLKQGQESKVDVIYIDILENNIQHVKQKYSRIADRTYRYENIPNDFEAKIQVDSAGLVIDYPQLFKRTAHHNMDC